MKIIECVPNVSEGRDRAILDALAAVVRATPGVELLDVDPGADTNRTVFTFVGGETAIAEAAFRFAKAAIDAIDMRAHRGAHPRMGAIDVCPFVPVGGGATMDDCVAIAREVGRRIGEELGVPVYLYEAAASRPERRSLAEVRKGEYEALPEKLQEEAWAPDFGPASFHARAGATAVGARPILIAYNVDLDTRDKKLAHDIALEIREQGRIKRDAAGKIARDAQGEALREPGRFDAVRAVGWYIPEFGRAQVSINLTNFHVTPPHVVFDAIRDEARRRGLRVTGSEIVGLVPLDALRQAGAHYLRGQGKTAAAPEPDLVEQARVSLGLDDVKPFDAADAVIEYRLSPRATGLRAMTITDFADELSRATPAPGGGSVAALVGALGAALVAMVSALTHGGGSEHRDALESLGERAQALKDALLRAVDDDTAAFDGMVAARRLPKKSDAEKAEREHAMLEATRRAIEVPLAVASAAAGVAALARDLAPIGMESAASDCGVAALAARAACEGAGLNVRINLAGLADEAEKSAYRARLDEHRRSADAAVAETLKKIDALVS